MRWKDRLRAGRMATKDGALYQEQENHESFTRAPNEAQGS